MLAIIWQGRSLSAVIMLPLLWYVLGYVLCSDDFSSGAYIVIVIVSLANVDLSGMGGIMASIIGGAFAVTYMAVKRKIGTAVMIGISVLPAGAYMILYKVLMMLQ